MKINLVPFLFGGLSSPRLVNPALLAGTRGQARALLPQEHLAACAPPPPHPPPPPPPPGSEKDGRKPAGPSARGSKDLSDGEGKELQGSEAPPGTEPEALGPCDEHNNGELTNEDGQAPNYYDSGQSGGVGLRRP